MKSTVKILGVLVGMQFVALLVLSIFILKTHPGFLLYILCAYPLFLLADLLLWRSIRKNADLLPLEIALEKQTEQSILKARYEKRQEKWRQDISGSRELISQKLSQIVRIMEQDEKTVSAQKEIKVLLEDIEDTLIQTRETHYCEHALSNIILSEKVEEAKQKQIEIQVKASVPDGLPPTDTQWCSIWCNLLDNAIEACERIEDGRRWITLKAAAVDGYFYIKLENAANPKQISTKTSKKDFLDHGFGRGILKELSVKYGGGFEEKPEHERYTSIFTIVDKKGS